MPLSANQEKGLAALLECQTIAEAATYAGLSEPTLYRYLKDPAFQTAYRAARRQLYEHGVIRLQRDINKAADTLVRNLSCGNPSAEVRAATVMYEKCEKGIEMLDILERLEALEDAANSKNAT